MHNMLQSLPRHDVARRDGRVTTRSCRAPVQRRGPREGTGSSPASSEEPAPSLRKLCLFSGSALPKNPCQFLAASAAGSATRAEGWAGASRLRQPRFEGPVVGARQEHYGHLRMDVSVWASQSEHLGFRKDVGGRQRGRSIPALLSADAARPH